MTESTVVRCPRTLLRINELRTRRRFSLYTPTQNYHAGEHYEAGWFQLRAPERWGTVAQCFPRAVLEELVRATGLRATEPITTSRDS